MSFISDMIFRKKLEHTSINIKQRSRSGPPLLHSVTKRYKSTSGRNQEEQIYRTCLNLAKIDPGKLASKIHLYPIFDQKKLVAIAHKALGGTGNLEVAKNLINFSISNEKIRIRMALNGLLKQIEQNPDQACCRGERCENFMKYLSYFDIQDRKGFISIAFGELTKILSLNSQSKDSKWIDCLEKNEVADIFLNITVDYCLKGKFITTIEAEPLFHRMNRIREMLIISQYINEASTTVYEGQQSKRTLAWIKFFMMIMFDSSPAIQISDCFFGSLLKNSLLFYIESLYDYCCHLIEINRSQDIYPIIKIIKKLIYAQGLATEENSPEVLKELVQKVKDLSFASQDDNLLIIPGEYVRGGGHSVLYSIEHLPNRSFSFIIWNSGEGSNKAMDLFRPNKNLVYYKKYIVPQEKINNNFLSMLLNYSLGGEEIEIVSQNFVNDEIHQFLVKPPFAGNVFEEDMHAENLRGSCVTRCISALLRVKMDLYVHFKYFMTDCALHEFNKFKRSLGSSKVSRSSDIAYILSILDISFARFKQDLDSASEEIDRILDKRMLKATIYNLKKNSDQKKKMSIVWHSAMVNPLLVLQSLQKYKVEDLETLSKTVLLCRVMQLRENSYGNSRFVKSFFQNERLPRIEFHKNFAGCIKSPQNDSLFKSRLHMVSTENFIREWEIFLYRDPTLKDKVLMQQLYKNSLSHCKELGFPESFKEFSLSDQLFSYIKDLHNCRLSLDQSSLMVHTETIIDALMLGLRISQMQEKHLESICEEIFNAIEKLQPFNINSVENGFVLIPGGYFKLKSSRPCEFFYLVSRDVFGEFVFKIYDGKNLGEYGGEIKYTSLSSNQIKEVVQLVLQYYPLKNQLLDCKKKMNGRIDSLLFKGKNRIIEKYNHSFVMLYGSSNECFTIFLRKRFGFQINLFLEQLKRESLLSHLTLLKTRVQEPAIRKIFRKEDPKSFYQFIERLEFNTIPDNAKGKDSFL